MPTAFDSDYAEFYDLIYSDKDYEAECNFLEEIWQRFCDKKPVTVLDVGCGTGGHTIPLARRGYTVTGIDASDSMIAVARGKAQSENLNVAFHVSPMEDMELRGQWDTILCMFNAINYVVGDEALKKALFNIRRHLLPGELFLFDYRNGVPSLRPYSPTRIKWIRDGNLRVLRISETKLDAMEQISHTTYTCLILDGHRLVKEFRDDHIVQFLFPREIQRHLRETGFEIVHTCRFLELDTPAAEEDWNITVIARAT